MKKYISIDLFAGCGGLSDGMKQAGFIVDYAVELDSESVLSYKMNHPETEVIQDDIRNVSPLAFTENSKNETIHLLAGCPPCQGFSSTRRLNRKEAVDDNRNNLILDYLRFVQALMPLTVMMENVPGIIDFILFKKLTDELQKIGYKIDYDVVNLADYGVPQRRKRLILLGSRLGPINIKPGGEQKCTVRDIIGSLESPANSNDPVHKIIAIHTQRIMEMIALIPINGGSRLELPEKYILNCHKKTNVGFNDVYGRLRWDDYSSTITGGCLNPSKGRFLHPEENRSISAREAAMLQTFNRNRKFPVDKISKTSLALQIGNALPPLFSYIQCKSIIEHLDYYLD